VVLCGLLGVPFYIREMVVLGCHTEGGIAVMVAYAMVCILRSWLRCDAGVYELFKASGFCLSV